MKLMVLDGNSIVNRAFYGIRLLSTRDGLYTNAVYGFLTILNKLLDEEGPDALCVAFDLAAPTFRHLEYEGYKASRKKMPDELAVQIPLLKEVLDAMNIPRYELEGFEADDLIGTIGAQCTKAGWECVAVTGDRDSLQLITDTVSVKLITTRMGRTETKLYTPEIFEAEYGFTPEKMIDLKGLMGDHSDEIPGVAGIGEKTALELVRAYGTIDAIYETLDTLEIKPGVRKKLAEGQEQALFSRHLATIQTDTPLPFAPDENLRRPADEPALYALFLRLEFSKLIEKYNLKPAADAPRPSAAPERACTRADAGCLPDLFSRWRAAPYVSVLPIPDLSGCAVCHGGGVSFLLHADLGEAYRPALTELFGPEIQKVSHDVKDLMRLLLAEGLPAEGFVFDTALAAYLLAATDGSYAPERLSVSYLGAELPSAAEFTRPDAFSPLGDPSGALSALAAHVGAVDALYPLLSAKLEALEMHALYYTVELPLCRVLAEMEIAGCRVDRRALLSFGEMLARRIEEIQNEIYALAGGEFNINSTKQLGVLLFETLGLPPVKKTKTGYSTDVEVLEQLRGQHPVVDAVMTYRTLTKLKSTYADGLLKVLGPDGRVRTSFQMTVTATGRLSSTEPNLQNIPTRTELGSELRRMFVPAEGSVLVDADYSQIELRLLAHMADDPIMRAAFEQGEDIHTVTASQVFHVPPEEVTPNMRRSAKAVNFGIVYGISEFSLAQDIGVPRWEAKSYMDAYFEKYAGVRAYMKRIVEEARRDGYVSTLMNRRRYLPELKNANYNVRSFGERVALNMPIQGTAADIMKLAMVRVSDRIRREGLRARLILQVHDELIVECPKEEAESAARLLTEEMEGVMRLSVPLRADAGAGENWLEAKH